MSKATCVCPVARFFRLFHVNLCPRRAVRKARKINKEVRGYVFSASVRLDDQIWFAKELAKLEGLSVWCEKTPDGLIVRKERGAEVVCFAQYRPYHKINNHRGTPFIVRNSAVWFNHKYFFAPDLAEYEGATVFLVWEVMDLLAHRLQRVEAYDVLGAFIAQALPIHAAELKDLTGKGGGA